jgi:hypothetical protein
VIPPGSMEGSLASMEMSDHTGMVQSFRWTEIMRLNGRFISHGNIDRKSQINMLHPEVVVLVHILRQSDIEIEARGGGYKWLARSLQICMHSKCKVRYNSNWQRWR